MSAVGRPLVGATAHPTGNPYRHAVTLSNDMPPIELFTSSDLSLETGGSAGLSVLWPILDL
jgi:hypothetical protein